MVDCDKDVTINYLTKKYSVALSALKRLSEEYGFRLSESQHEKWSRERDSIESKLDELVQLNKSGMSLKEISNENQISIELLKRVFRENNIQVSLHSYNKSKGELEVKEFIRSLGFECNSVKRKYNNKRFEIDCFMS